MQHLITDQVLLIEEKFISNVKIGKKPKNDNNKISINCGTKIKIKYGMIN